MTSKIFCDRCNKELDLRSRCEFLIKRYNQPLGKFQENRDLCKPCLKEFYFRFLKEKSFVE